MSGSVLVVDDDPLFRALASRLLTAMGFAVAGEAENVASATTAARELRPDAVLLDVWLPEGHSIGLARDLAALPWHPIVVMTSTDADAVSPAAILWAGAKAFVPKDELPSSHLEQLLA
jgi:DNA-binding NarL/FixJ family response regulator